MNSRGFAKMLWSRALHFFLWADGKAGTFEIILLENKIFSRRGEKNVFSAQNWFEY
jgi:hypothetical protein